MTAREREPGAPVWQITAEQLASGYWRRHRDGTVTNHPFVVLAKLEDGTFEVIAPSEERGGDVLEEEEGGA